MKLLLEGLTQFRNYSHKQALGEEGMRVYYWHILRRGTVLSEAEGLSTLLLTPGCLLAIRGENPSDEQAVYKGTYTASGDALVERLSSRIYQQLPLNDKEPVNEVLFKSLSKTYAVLRETRQLMNTRTRLGARLEQFFDRFGSDDLEIPSQGDLGKIIGCSLEAVSRELTHHPETFASSRQYFRRHRRQMTYR